MAITAFSLDRALAKLRVHRVNRAHARTTSCRPRLTYRLHFKSLVQLFVSFGVILHLSQELSKKNVMYFGHFRKLITGCACASFQSDLDVMDAVISVGTSLQSALAWFRLPRAFDCGCGNGFLFSQRPRRVSLWNEVPLTLIARRWPCAFSFFFFSDYGNAGCERHCFAS